MATEESYEAYCKRDDYRWDSHSEEKPPRCPECQRSDEVIYGDDIPTEEDPGTPLVTGIDRHENTIPEAAAQTLNLSEDAIDWEWAREHEGEHRTRTIVIHFEDTNELFAIKMNTVEKKVNVLDRSNLRSYTGKPEGFVQFVSEDIGWQIINGDIPLQVARYEMREDVMKIATHMKHELFWMACSSIFNDIREHNLEVEEQLEMG